MKSYSVPDRGKVRLRSQNRDVRHGASVFRTPPSTAAMLRFALVSLAAAPMAAATINASPRLLAGAHFGTAGLELVGSAEWTVDAELKQRLRPEVLINDDPKIGLGFSWTFAIAEGKLPEGQELYLGPRYVYHNNDEEDIEGEVAAVAFYRFPLRERQGIDAVLGFGFIDEKNDWDPAFTIGAAYGFQF